MATRNTPSDAATASRQLAQWCAALAWEDVPDHIRTLLPLRLLDSVGLIIAGCDTNAIRTARYLAQTRGGIAQSTVVGGATRIPASSAALVNAAAAHCHDFDDTFTESVVHPGCVVIPTALAVAEAMSSTNEDFATGIALGYEIASRLGAVSGKRFHARNLHPTGIVGPMVSAAVAGRLMKLPAEQISWAMGLAASMAGGLRAYSVDGGWSKWLHPGWAANGGITAAELAAGGFRGPEHVLDGKYDLYASLLHGDQLDRTPLLDKLGAEWISTSGEFKYYPCAHAIHPFIDAVLRLVEDHALCGPDIDLIECTIAPWAAAIVCEPVAAKLRFDSELEATGSLPYQLAYSVLERRAGLDALTPASRARSDIADLARRITYRTDQSLGPRFGGSVTIRTVNRASLTSDATMSALDIAQLNRKFHGIVSGFLGPAKATASAASLHQSLPDWRASAKLLAHIPVTVDPISATPYERSL